MPDAESAMEGMVLQAASRSFYAGAGRVRNEGMDLAAGVEID
jgi:hypothetical protein